MNTLRLSQLSLLMITFLSGSLTYAAGLERSQQPMAPFFEKGNYAELSYIYIKPDIESTDIFGHKVDNMMKDHSMEGATVKIAPTENSALAIMYNKPWGVDTLYPKNNLFHNSLGATQSHVEAENIGLIVGGKPDNSNFMIYGGVEYQTVSGHVTAATSLGKGGQSYL